jgi:hypothetical protein
VHKCLPQLLARLDVEKRHGEKDYGEQQHHCVLHSGSPLFIRHGAKTVDGNGSIENQIQLGASALCAEPELPVLNPAPGRANHSTEIDFVLGVL